MLLRLTPLSFAQRYQEKLVQQMPGPVCVSGSLLCAVFTGIVPESRETKISTQHQSLTALLRQRAWLGIIVRQGIEPLRKFGLKGGSGLGIYLGGDTLGLAQARS